MKYDEIFREYDIRGIFEKDLTEDSVKAIGLALGKKFNEFGVKTLSVGFDARLSASTLFRYLLSGLNKAGGFKIYSITCYQLLLATLAFMLIISMQTS